MDLKDTFVKISIVLAYHDTIQLQANVYPLSNITIGIDGYNGKDDIYFYDLKIKTLKK